MGFIVIFNLFVLNLNKVNSVYIELWLHLLIKLFKINKLC
jgi:hypothetical protein